MQNAVLNIKQYVCKYLSLKISDKKKTAYRAQIGVRLYTAVSVALTIPSSVKRETENI